jgi:type VI secretion system Hcp family effector
MVNSENIQLTIRYYGKNSNGSVSNTFTYLLTNAKVAAIRNWQPNANDPAATPYAHPEEVSFVYNTITWRDETSGIEFQKTW